MEKLVNPPKNESKLVNPPADESKLKEGEGKPAMLEPQKKGQKTFKIVALKPFNLGKVEYKDGQVINDSTRTVQPGEIVEVDREKAKELCKKIIGAFNFTGERYNKDGQVHRHDLSRARLATPNDIMGVKPAAPGSEDDIFGD